MPRDGLTDIKPIYDPNSRQLAYNNRTDRVRVELPASADVAASGCVDFPTVEHNMGTLDTPGVTATFLSQSSSKHAIQYTIEDINTSVEVTASGSLDASGWYNPNPSGTTTVRTENGTYVMTFDGMAKYILFSFLSETGGTDARITAKYLGGC